MSGGELRSVAFRREREREWRELERMVVAVERRGLRALAPSDAARLPLLHRTALASLSVARATSLDRNALEYLEALAARSHAALHGGRESGFRLFLKFFLVRFPVAVRGIRGAVAVSALALLSGTAAGWTMVAADQGRFFEFVEPGLAGDRGPQSSTEDLRSTLFGEKGGVGFATFLFAHNTQVGIIAFIVGLAGGVPTLLLLFATGLMLGAFGGLFGARDLGVELWGWILPHGVTELLAIVLAGAAGITIGTAWLFPGARTRAGALRRAGREAGVVVLGCAALFAVAGLFEGVFRQEVHDTSVRYLVAALFAAVWIVYFSVLGRGAVAEDGP